MPPGLQTHSLCVANHPSESLRGLLLHILQVLAQGHVVRVTSCLEASLQQPQRPSPAFSCPALFFFIYLVLFNF